MANSLRLLKLPPKAREMVIAGQLSMGHARALLGLDAVATIEAGAAQVTTKGALGAPDRGAGAPPTKAGSDGAPPSGKSPAAPTDAPKEKSASVRDVESRLQRALGTRVQLNQRNNTAGTIEIHYHSLDELDGLLARLTNLSHDPELD